MRTHFMITTMAPKTLLIIVFLGLPGQMTATTPTTTTGAVISSTPKSNTSYCQKVFEGWVYAMYHKGGMNLMTVDVQCCRPKDNNSEKPELLIDVGNKTRTGTCNSHPPSVQPADCHTDIVHVSGLDQSRFYLSSLRSCCLNQPSRLSEKVAYHLRMRPANFGLETWAMYTIGLLGLGSFSSFYPQLIKNLQTYHYAGKA
ncbi:membrane glycoprotein UL40 [Panine betaherpesvirus 2]|uniref:Membrane glycoprotein UL40 n=1 Tax=Panine betaherpesvirus 2 TaxID=188763 RepID=Q8QS49_9BETA|nr:membrane glycoprotein UL40 [Panine betaherpesvirus 2]AAM00689.1 membrane glycoprotein UL40 [Panine betaherpesvirus 2]QXV67794.1 membrane glycoprotein UL40 [Panine betaherpesvirus 2]